MPRAAVLPVFAVARHRVFPTAVLAVFRGALLAILAAAAIHGHLIVFVVFLAAVHLLAATAGHGFSRFTLFALAAGLGRSISRGLLAVVFHVFAAGTRGLPSIRACGRWRCLLGSGLRSGALLGSGWQPCRQRQYQKNSNDSKIHFFTSIVFFLISASGKRVPRGHIDGVASEAGGKPQRRRTVLETKSGKGKESEAARTGRVVRKVSGNKVAAAVTTNLASCGLGTGGSSASSVELPETEQQLRLRDLCRGQMGETEGWACVELASSGGQQL
jgi:hypothetical protein